MLFDDGGEEEATRRPGRFVLVPDKAKILLGGERSKSTLALCVRTKQRITSSPEAVQANTCTLFGLT